MKRWLAAVLFAFGAACGFGAATYLSARDFAAMEKRLALSRDRGETWRVFAQELEIDLKQCQQEQYAEAKQ